MHAPRIWSEPFNTISVIDGVLAGCHRCVTGVLKPIAVQPVTEVAEVNECVCPLVGEGRTSGAHDKLLAFVATGKSLHGIVRFSRRGKIGIRRARRQDVEEKVFAVGCPSSKQTVWRDVSGWICRKILRKAGDVGMVCLRIREPPPVHLSVKRFRQTFDLSAKILSGSESVNTMRG